MTLKYKYFLLFALGGLMNLGFIPFYLFIFPMISISGFLFFIFKENQKKSYFWNGWCFGLGYFGFGLYWISNALLTDRDFFWLIPFAIILIPSILAIYIGLFSYLCSKLKNNNHITFTLFASVVWVIIEIARTYFFTGFPWLSLGYIYGASSNLEQAASVIGLFGLSLMGFLSCSLFFAAKNFSYKSTYTFIVIVILSNLVMYFSGNYYLKNYTHRQTKNIIRVVQPNIHQLNGLSLSERKEYLDVLLNLSTRNIPNTSNYIIWPELPLPMFLFNQKTIDLIYQKIPKHISVISNSLRINYLNHKIYNSSVLLKDNKLIDFYDKSHLVPFGEYVPLKSFLPLEKITQGYQDFSAGAGLKTIKNENYSLGILICYESFFPSKIFTGQKPGFIVNLTNDVWYGESQGPYLHYEMTRFRAIEEKIPIYRAANNGISACIDANGFSRKKILLNKIGYIDCPLIVSDKKLSFYNKYKYIGLLLLIFILILLIYSSKKVKT